MAKTTIENDEDHVKLHIANDMKAFSEKHGEIKNLDHIMNFVTLLSLDSTRCTRCGFPEKYHIRDAQPNRLLRIFKPIYLRCPEV